MNLGNQLLRKCPLRDLASGLPGRLGYIIGRATGKGFNGHPGAALGQRTAHDYWHPVSASPQLFERDQTIHDRHLHIQQDQIGVKDREAIQGRGAVGGGAGNFKAGVGADDRAQQAAHYGRVVDD